MIFWKQPIAGLTLAFLATTFSVQALGLPLLRRRPTRPPSGPQADGKPEPRRSRPTREKEVVKNIKERALSLRPISRT
jgi:hypothetical protein